MAKKDWPGGIVILVLLILGLVHQYSRPLFPILGVILGVWVISKLVGKRFGLKSKSQHTLTASTSKTSTAKKLSRAVSPDTVWVTRDESFHHEGYTIPEGFVYFGTGLKAIQGGFPDPCLIDPRLPVDKSQPDFSGRHMNYWPSYSEIHPTSRAAFLAWLSSGKKDPSAYIGYVFIYFYGLERRVFADAKHSVAARDEIPAIIAEVKRLLSIYGGNSSFCGYATRFIDAIAANQAEDAIYRSPPQIQSGSFELPKTIQMALGQIARDGVPLPVEWALAWAENDPVIPHRTPFQRCPEQFRELFKIRYYEKYGDGFKIRPNKKRIQAWYHPASASFGGQVLISALDLPDVTAATGPQSKIAKLVLACTDELDAYSRFLGRNPDHGESPESIAYLPKELLKRHSGNTLKRLAAWLDSEVPADQPISVPFSTLLRQFESVEQEGFGKREATGVANMLRKMDFGIEPDPRFGSIIPKPNQEVVLFRIGVNAPNSPSQEYLAATVIMHLAAAVAATDGAMRPEEESYIESQIEKWLHLSRDEKVRLKAHTRWLLTSFPGMNGLRRRIKILRHDQRESLGRFLVGVAQADGYIDPEEIKALTKIYSMLGLDTKSLFSHAHSAAVEPVTVQMADYTKTASYSIPSPRKKHDRGVSLDMSNIEAKLAETNAVSAILNNIFIEDEPGQSPAVMSEQKTVGVAIPGLDPETYAFMQALGSKQTWTREELEMLASKHNIMLDGTLDSINDALFDHFGGPFFEGDDPIEINADFAKVLAT